MPNDGDNHEIQNEVGAIPTSSPINTDKFIEALDNVQTNQKRLDTKVDNISAEVSKLDSFVTSYIVENGAIVRDIDSLKSELSQQSIKIDEISNSLTNAPNKSSNKEEKEEENSESEEKKEKSEEKEEKSSNKNILKRVKLSIDNALKKTSSKSLFSTPSLVRITSFSKQGKEELIEGLKQVFTIKKKENSKLNFKTPLIVLAILALIGVFTFLAIKIAAIKKEFKESYDTIKSEKQSFVSFLINELFPTNPDVSSQKSVLSQIFASINDTCNKLVHDKLGDNKNIGNALDVINKTIASDDFKKYAKSINDSHYTLDQKSKLFSNYFSSLNRVEKEFKENFTLDKLGKPLKNLNIFSPGLFANQYSPPHIDAGKAIVPSNDNMEYEAKQTANSGGNLEQSQQNKNNSYTVNDVLSRALFGRSRDSDSKQPNNSSYGNYTGFFKNNNNKNSVKIPFIPPSSLVYNNGNNTTEYKINPQDTVVINKPDGIIDKHLQTICNNSNIYTKQLSDLINIVSNSFEDTSIDLTYTYNEMRRLHNAIDTLNKKDLSTIKHEIYVQESRNADTGVSQQTARAAQMIKNSAAKQPQIIV